VIRDEGAARGDTAVYSGGEKDDGQVGHMKGIGVCYNVSHHGNAEGPSSSDWNGLSFVTESDDQTLVPEVGVL
jgi:hypothetical protein